MNNPRIDSWGNKYWQNDNVFYHREDGPAIEYSNGNKYWYINGILHREDGPAVECNGGYKEWWYGGKCIGYSFSQGNFTQEDFDKYLRSLKIKEYW